MEVTNQKNTNIQRDKQPVSVVFGKRKVALSLKDIDDVPEQKKKKKEAEILVASQIGGFCA